MKMKLFFGAVVYCLGMMWACAEADEVWVKDRWENAFELYREIPKEEGNVVFSPYGASTLMGLAYGGARGETATQIEKGFHFTSDPKLFRVDHPFLFFIIEPETKMILFMGRVIDPRLQ